MLNKIWAGLIIVGLSYAFIQDVYDNITNRYNNGQPLQLNYHVANNNGADSLSLVIDFNDQRLDASLIAEQQLRIYLGPQSPARLTQIAEIHGNKTQLNAELLSKSDTRLTLRLPDIHWLKLRQVTDAVFETAEFAVKLALGLIGIMALWLGLMQIVEKSGLINYLVRFVQPLLRWLFPNIPKNHPAFASISMNMSANILGLGNAATPLGIKAMQQLQTLNRDPQTASDEMCMFLALNTSSVQLLPPVTLIALMGTQISELMIPIILATSCSTITAVIVAKLYAARRRAACNS
jgi:spore maturation protein A